MAVDDRLRELRQRQENLKKLQREAGKITGQSRRRPDAGNDSYARKKVAAAERSRQQTAVGTDCGVCPPIADLDRRRRCRDNLKLFGETYVPGPLKKPCGLHHLQGIARLEECVTLGALLAQAFPRGEGKTTWLQIAALWATAYAWRRFAFIIGATEAKAVARLDAIQKYLRFLPTFAADFPEICMPVIHLGGQPRRCQGQHSAGVPTMMEWSDNQIVLPTIAPPANWPAEWPLRPDGMVPTSGSIIGTAGLSAEGIRGAMITTTAGENLRPDIVFLDDPQTDDSSKSWEQTDKREDLIKDAILGLAAPGESIACIIACTCIEPGDLSDRFLDTTRNPLWRGQRVGALEKMPDATTLEQWERYIEVYSRGLNQSPASFAEANRYYREHRGVLEADLVATWPERKNSREVSAIQNLIHTYARLGLKGFMSAMMNRPLASNANQIEELTPARVLERTNDLPRSICPDNFPIVSAFIDVRLRQLHWCVVAWEAGPLVPQLRSGAVIDYGIFGLAPGTLDTNAISRGLSELVPRILGNSWTLPGRVEQGAPPKVTDILCVDAGFKPDEVYEVLGAYPNAFASRGAGIGARNKPMSEWALTPGEVAGWNWILQHEIDRKRERLIHWLQFDANAWKTSVSERLRSTPGSLGSISLWGSKDEGRQHRAFAEHLTSEFRPLREADGRRVVEWIAKPGKPPNHWWDCLVGCAVGLSLREQLREMALQAARRPKSNLEEQYKQGIKRDPL